MNDEQLFIGPCPLCKLPVLCQQLPAVAEGDCYVVTVNYDTMHICRG